MYYRLNKRFILIKYLSGGRKRLLFVYKKFILKEAIFLKLDQPQFREIKKANEVLTISNIDIINTSLKRKIRIVTGYRKLLSSEFGLLSKYPYLQLYWDFEKNRGINPRYICPRSELYVLWTCRLGYSIRMKVKSRVRYVDCKVCEKMVTPVEGSLLEIYPHIAKEWDYGKNYPLLPTAIKPRARRKIWWVCSEKQHSYSASPDNRVGHGSGCKRCASSKPRRKSKK